jgi:FkbM family methyltransferase
MSFVSYAQNFEDVILYRALKHISQGFYIDIGASDPTIDSVSLAFHHLRWSGIHVEPLTSHAEALRCKRPQDLVLQVAVAQNPGDITLFEVGEGYGISTCDAKIAETHRKNGFKTRDVTVPCVRLSEIFERYTKGDVHWLKIDVEGFEAEVIRSWSGSSVRPWIVVLESTEPMTTIPCFEAWEPSLIELGYHFVYFDGLNRFYVSDAHPELDGAFQCGPNFFDGFTIPPTHWMWRPALEAASMGQLNAHADTPARLAFWQKLSAGFNARRPHFGPVKRRIRRALGRGPDTVAAGLPKSAEAGEAPFSVPGVAQAKIEAFHAALEQAMRTKRSIHRRSIQDR